MNHSLTITQRDRDESHGRNPRIMNPRFVTVEGRSRPSGRLPPDTEGRKAMTQRLTLGAVSATCRAALRHLDSWTLTTLNADGRRPRLG